jgi:ABC-2 type transport system permease protein
MIGRFISVFLPVIIALLIGVVWGVLKGGELPFEMLFLYSTLLFGLSFSFLGIAFLISSIVKSHDIAIGISFVVWMVFLAFIDVALIGLMLQNRISDEVIISISLLNPMEVFRVAAISLFDPELTVIGPVAYYILDNLGKVGFIIYSTAYPLFIGLVTSYLGYMSFKKRDIL